MAYSYSIMSTQWGKGKEENRDDPSTCIRAHASRLIGPDVCRRDALTNVNESNQYTTHPTTALLVHMLMFTTHNITARAGAG
jgi:hypothetical protein